MDDFPGDGTNRGLGRRADAWSSAPVHEPPAPRWAGRASELVLVGALAALLLDTFAPWQRICVNVSTSYFNLSGCLSANAWSGNGSGFGIAAGVCTILALMALVLNLAGVVEGESATWLERVLVSVAVGLGGLKWLLVIGKAASVGAWLGVLLLFTLAAVETVRARS